VEEEFVKSKNSKLYVWTYSVLWISKIKEKIKMKEKIDTRKE
jgi:hypothetical protein